MTPKTLKLKLIDGILTGKPFWGVSVEIVKSLNRGWIADVIIDGEVKRLRDYRTRKALLFVIDTFGNQLVNTWNCLNPNADTFSIARRYKGTVQDPAREAYHCM